MANPNFGKWLDDDEFDPTPYSQAGDAFRYKRQSVAPCDITVGRFTVESVFYPTPKTTAVIEDLAIQTVKTLGFRQTPWEYPVPKGVRDKYVPFYRLCLVKILEGIVEIG